MDYGAGLGSLAGGCGVPTCPLGAPPLAACLVPREDDFVHAYEKDNRGVRGVLSPPPALSEE